MSSVSPGMTNAGVRAHMNHLNSLAFFRPHRSTTYVYAAYCYRPSSMVCQSVCLSVGGSLWNMGNG